MNQKQNKRNELFIKACASGFSDIVTFMLEAGGIDPNYSDFKDLSALWYAIHGGHLDIARTLLRLDGLDVLTLNTAIEEALKQGQNDLMQELLEYPNAATHCAKGKKDEELLRLCDELHGYDFDVLTAAIKTGNDALVEKIIDAANVYINQEADFTPLVSAIERGKVNWAAKLIEKPSLDVNACGKMEVPPLSAAVKYPEIVKMLLARKDISLRRKDKKGNTALHNAVRENSFETVQMLVEYGCNIVNAVNKDASCFLTEESQKNLASPFGDTPTAPKDRTFGYQPLFGRRIAKGLFDKAGLTALQIAVALGHSDIAVYLINEANACIDTPLPGGVPLLFSAISQKMTAVVEAILRRLPFEELDTAFPDPKNQSQKITALHVAFRARALDIFRLLLKYPTDVNYGQCSETRDDVMKGTILGEVFYCHRHYENVFDYMEALLKRSDLNVYICTDSPIDSRTVFQIMSEEKSEFLDYRPSDDREAKEPNNGYCWHC